MKPSSFIVNVARGPVIKTRALVQALTEGWIAGAGIDTLEGEPPGPDHPLYAFQNAILTPHFAWYSRDSIVELHSTVAEEASRALRGKPPASCVNPEILESWNLKWPSRESS